MKHRNTDGEIWREACAPELPRDRLLLAVCNDLRVRGGLAIAHALAFRSDPKLDDPVWPSRARLAADVGLDVRTVDRWIGALERAGYLSVERQRGGGNAYRLHLPAIHCAPWNRAGGDSATGDSSVAGDARVASGASVAGVGSAPEERQDCRPTPDRIGRGGATGLSPEQIREQIQEQTTNNGPVAVVGRMPEELDAYLRNVDARAERPSPQEAAGWIAKYGARQVRAAAHAVAERVKRGKADCPLRMLRAAVQAGWYPNGRDARRTLGEIEAEARWREHEAAKGDSIL